MNKKNYKIATCVLAVLLAGVTLASAIGFGKATDGFRDWSAFKQEQLEQENGENNDVVEGGDVADTGNVDWNGGMQAPEENVGEGVAIRMVKRAVTNVDQYDVTATVTPADSANTVTMSVAWKNPSSTWANGKNVNDYVTISQTTDGALTGVLTNKKAFGEQVILTVTSRQYTGAKATATIDYVKRLQDSFITVSGPVTMSESSSSLRKLTYTVTPTYSDGTLTGTISYGALTARLEGTTQENLEAEMAEYGFSGTVKSSITIAETFSPSATINMPLYTDWISGVTWNNMSTAQYKNAYVDMCSAGDCYIQFYLSVTYSYGGKVYNEWVQSSDLFKQEDHELDQGSLTKTNIGVNINNSSFIF